MIKNSVSKLKEIFRGKRLAYLTTFNLESPPAVVVMEDLAKFCRAHESTFTKDERTTVLLEGRREVWMRIQTFLQLTDEEVYKLHHIKGGD